MDSFVVTGRSTNATGGMRTIGRERNSAVSHNSMAKPPMFTLTLQPPAHAPGALSTIKSKENPILGARLAYEVVEAKSQGADTLIKILENKIFVGPLIVCARVGLTLGDNYSLVGLDDSERKVTVRLDHMPARCIGARAAAVQCGAGKGQSFEIHDYGTEIVIAARNIVPIDDFPAGLTGVFNLGPGTKPISFERTEGPFLGLPTIRIEGGRPILSLNHGPLAKFEYLLVAPGSK
ncbi:MAG: hypothetical protein V1909_04575 [Candidatus Micrarchaeota archaeon]